jgi:hypothetical protein
VPKANKLDGQTFHKLTVIERSGIARNGKIKWLCRCDCGKEAIVVGTDLITGNTKSCGCYKNQMIRDRSFLHGQSRKRIHNIWSNIDQRCNNSNNKSYRLYGAAGITLCESWNEFINFLDWSTINGYQETLTIDRKDNSKGYSPDNCRWVSMESQQRNRTNNRYLTINGETKMLCEWSEETGIHHTTILTRIKRGWKEEKWLFPVNK